MGRGSYPMGKYICVDQEERFRILRVIAGSTNYVTMEAFDEKKNRECFLKVHEITDKKDEDYRENNLLREGSFRFSYPFIEEIYGSFKGCSPMGDPLVGVCGEYVRGQDLEEYRESLEKKIQKVDISEEDAERIILRQIYEFLHGMEYYLRYANPPYLHRDLKPANIMILPSEDVKIVDFDYAHISGSTDTIYVGGHGVGFSRGYASPRVLRYERGQPDTFPGEQEEIYAAGRILFFWLNGKPYFENAEMGEKENGERYKTLESKDQTLYWNNPNLAYSHKAERFHRKYREKRYEKLMEILRKMCSDPSSEDAYRNISDVKTDMKNFLLEYCGNSCKTFERYFDLPFLLDGNEDANIEDAPMVAYGIFGADAFLSAKVLAKNSMRDILMDKRKVMTVYNRDHKIWYLPALGMQVERENIQGEDTREIRNGDIFIVNGKKIRFTIG